MNMNVNINYISGVKLFGINISNNLKWNKHIQSLCSKLNKVFYMITSLIGEQLIYVKKYILYFAKFRSLIRYGIILWRREIESLQV
jgi:hypothetical protein